MNNFFYVGKQKLCLKPPPLYRYYDLFTSDEKVIETAETRKGHGQLRNQPVLESTQPVGSSEASASGSRHNT